MQKITVLPQDDGYVMILVLCVCFFVFLHFYILPLL